MCDIIYGGKPLNLPGIERLLYAHDTVFRINLNTHNLDETMCMKDVYYLNSHVYDYYTNPNITVEQLLDIYKHKGTQRKYIENMLEIIRNGKFKNIKKQPFSGNLEANRLLSYIRCPVQFHGQPRCGYQCLLENLNRKNFVIGFGLDDDDISFYNNPDKSVILTACHSVESEKQVLRWMHETGTIDASYCLLTDNTIPQLDCKLLKPTADSITNLLKIYGICVLDNYFSSEIIDKFNEEYDRVFVDHPECVEVLDKESCSNDERIFHCEKYSKYIDNNFASNRLFTEVVGQWTHAPANKKTLINKIVYEDGKVKNSGAGWHRDNHHCQLKAMVYLSDVNDRNGNFQFITNSSARHIGMPKPRTPSYNTRFHDSTVDNILENCDECVVHDVTGPRGTVVLVDTTNIHRGNIIMEGERRAMTQYFF